jgi:tetratricopeptide (TPR) repeat protein
MQERHEEARDAAKRGLAEDPEHLGGFLVLSACLAGLKDFDTALQVVRSGLQIAPDVAQFHRQEGALLLAQNRPTDALGPLTRARTLDPEDSDIAALVGAALFNARQFADSERAVAEALLLDPENPEAHRIRGLLSLRKGASKPAIEAHQTALRLDPTDPDFREGLATAMKSRNPLYGLLLRFSDWMDGLPSGARWLILLAPYLASRVLRPFDHETWAQVLLAVIVGLALMSWALEPIANTVLLCSSYARNLLPRRMKFATYAFLAYVAAAITAATVAIVTDADSGFVLAIGLALVSVSAGNVHGVDEKRWKLAVRIHAAVAVLAVLAVTAAILGLPAATGLGIALIFCGIALLWFGALA